VRDDLQVEVAALGEDQPVDLLLVKHRGEVHGVLAPGDIACSL
jgi:hypothetical protein